MNKDIYALLSEEVLAKIRRHAEGTENLKPREVGCHYCGFKTIIVYENSKGYISAKCKKCGKSAIYNVALRRGNRNYPFY